MTENSTLARRASATRAPGTSGPVCGQAFTLVEILVVIGIIGLLLAIMVPSLQTIKMKVLDIKCRANLKHLADAFHLGPDTAKIPNPWGWISAAEASGGSGITSCPLGGFEDGGSQTPAKTSGAVVSISPPPSVVFNDFESSSKIFMFTEQSNFPLPVNVTVDITDPGYYERNYSSTSSVITAGTSVDCHFVFFDPVGNQSSTVSGAISFGTEILGIICTRGPLDATDSVLGVSGTRYDTGRNARNFENGAERVTLSDDRLTFTINNFHATYPGENVRILTQPGSGGSGSFGMNTLVTSEHQRAGQILLIDYESSVIYPRSAWHVTALENMEDDGRLHMGKHLNAVMTDGSVRSFTPDELGPDSDLW